MDLCETLVKKLDKDVEELEQLRETPILSCYNIWDQEIRLLKEVRDNMLKSFNNVIHQLDQLEAMRGRSFIKRLSGSSDINPPPFRMFRLQNQVRLIQTIDEVEKALKALDPNEFSIFKLDEARQQLGHARQEAIRKMTEMGLWAKAAAWVFRRSTNLPS